MTLRGLAGLIVAFAMVAGCSRETEITPQEVVDMNAVRADLQAVSKARILMGHQSVGRNVIAGLQELAAEAGVPLRIEVIDGVPPDAGPGFFHSEIGRNGDPAGKCEAFSHLLIRAEQPAYDLAMMKFCYADLRGTTPLNVDEMTDRYFRLVAELKAQRPDVKLVHITVPLKADPVGRKAKLKRFVGMSLDEDADNVLRNAFNERLRERVAGEPLFDLAKVESTRANGTSSTFTQGGQQQHSLAQEYTDDGGHLNALGRRRAAIEFVRVLAGALSGNS